MFATALRNSGLSGPRAAARPREGVEILAVDLDLELLTDLDHLPLAAGHALDQMAGNPVQARDELLLDHHPQLRQSRSGLAPLIGFGLEVHHVRHPIDVVRHLLGEARVVPVVIPAALVASTKLVHEIGHGPQFVLASELPVPLHPPDLIFLPSPLILDDGGVVG